MPECLAAHSKLLLESSHVVKHLHAVIAEISHHHIAFLIQDETIGTVELAICYSLRPKCAQEFALGIKDLDPVVQDVSHKDVIIAGVCVDTPWFIELANTRALGAKCPQELTLPIKYLNPMVVSVCGNDLELGIGTHREWTIKLSITLSLGAELHDRSHDLVVISAIDGPLHDLNGKWKGM